MNKWDDDADGEFVRLVESDFEAREFEVEIKSCGADSAGLLARKRVWNVAYFWSARGIEPGFLAGLLGHTPNAAEHARELGMRGTVAQEIAIDEHLGVMEMYPGPCGKVYIGDKLAAAGTAKTMKLKRVEGMPAMVTLIDETTGLGSSVSIYSMWTGLVDAYGEPVEPLVYPQFADLCVRDVRLLRLARRIGMHGTPEQEKRFDAAVAAQPAADGIPFRELTLEATPVATK